MNDKIYKIGNTIRILEYSFNERKGLFTLGKGYKIIKISNIKCDSIKVINDKGHEWWIYANNTEKFIGLDQSIKLIQDALRSIE